MSKILPESIICQACNKKRKPGHKSYVCQPCFDNWFYSGYGLRIPCYLTSENQQRRYVILSCRRNNGTQKT